MTEHTIRLRGGWTVEPPGTLDLAPSPGRLTLPIAASNRPRRPARLIREFTPPRVDPSRERVALRIGKVPGLVAARLNGVEVGLDGGIAETFEIDLGRFLDARRVRLEMEVRPAAAESEGESWGEVALVIRAGASIGRADSSAAASRLGSAFEGLADGDPTR